MSLEHSPERQDHREFQGSDPILTFRQGAAELGVSLATFRRAALPYLETVLLSPQRRGVRLSVLEAFKRARTRPAARLLEEELEEA